jgi:excinuclease ABC subunit B
LRDEIKRLQQTELVVANDPLARPAEVEKRVSEATGSKMGRKWTPKKHRRSR